MYVDSRGNSFPCDVKFFFYDELGELPSIGSNGERVGILGCIVRDLVLCQFQAFWYTVAGTASSPW